MGICPGNLEIDQNIFSIFNFHDALSGYGNKF